METDRLLLVGDNPFHGVSHLSQARARARQASITQPQRAAELVSSALASGANGFLFSVNDATLAILRVLRQEQQPLPPRLYAIVPYSYEHVRSAIALGGIPSLARQVGGEIVRSRNWRAIARAIAGGVTRNPGALLQAYVRYEVSRLGTVVGRNSRVASVLLHEIITDMAAALDAAWLFRAFIASVTEMGGTPGFDTRNLPFLVRKLRAWRIEPRGLVFAAPFNSIGFQMCPSKTACEDALETVKSSTVIGFSILAAGFLTMDKAAQYIVNLHHLSGVAVGVSTVNQARETFNLLKDAYRKRA